MTFRVIPGTLATDVIGFFALNPDEELTLDDVAAKFVGPNDSLPIHTRLMPAIDSQFLDWNSERGVYTRGGARITSVERVPTSLNDGPARKRKPAPDPAGVMRPPALRDLVAEGWNLELEGEDDGQEQSVVGSREGRGADHGRT